MGLEHHEIGVVSDETFHRHDTGPSHPESSQRLNAVEEAIDGFSDKFVRIQPREASYEELTSIHEPEYIDKILSINSHEILMLDPDTAFSPDTKRAALMAVGGVLEAVNKITGGDIDRAFCAVRPPGHHAEPDRAMGFCIFNNIAIGAAHAAALNDVNRVAIVDWDLHHGNGTQRAFYERDDILYISLHQYPYYPGSGSPDEKGRGRGSGYTVNIPLHAGSGDDDYRGAFKHVVLPELTKFEPEMIFISAGFDAHRSDPLGGMSLSSEFFGEMTRMLREVADRFCRGRIVSVLEGGYSLAALKESVTWHLKELSS